MTKATPKPRVLICDDDPGNYSKLKNYLESENFECSRRASSAAEVRQLLRDAQKSRKFFLFVMIDMDMGLSPGSPDGAQIYHNLLPDFPNEEYIIYSSSDADQFRDQINLLMYRSVRFVLLSSLLRERNIRLQLSAIVSSANPNSVFLVHGRNLKRRGQIEKLLEVGFGLRTVSWEDARSRVASPRPYIYEIVLKGIEMSHLTLVLFTDDEYVELKAALKDASERRSRAKRAQARANVFIEAGYAMGVRPRRTIFLEWPESQKVAFHSPSDFSGIHVARFDGGADARRDLRWRLEDARCALKLSKGWETMRL